MKNIIILSIFLISLTVVSCRDNDRTEKDSIEELASWMNIEEDEDTLNTLLNDIYYYVESMDPTKSLYAKRINIEKKIESALRQVYYGKPFTSDSILTETENYYIFDSRSLTAMRYCYLAGSVYRDMGDYAAALENYDKAIWHSRFIVPNDSVHSLLKEVYAAIAGLQHRLFDYYALNNNKEKQKGSLSLEKAYIGKYEQYSWKSKDTLQALRAFHQSSLPYYHECDTARIMSILKDAKAKYEIRGYQSEALEAGLQIAELEIAQGDMAGGKVLVDDYESRHLVDGTAVVSTTAISLYNKVKGDILMKSGNAVAAIGYYRMLLNDQHSTDNVMAGCKGLVEAFRATNQSDSIYKYAQLLSQVRERNASELSSLFDYDKLQRQKEYADNDYSNLLLGIVLFAVAVIAVASYAMYRYNWRRALHKKELLEQNKKYSATLSAYHTSLSELQSLNEQHNAYAQQKEREMEELRKILAAYQEESAAETRIDMENTLMSLPIIIRLHANATKGIKATNAEIETIITEARHFLPHFFLKIEDKKYALNEREVTVSLLTKLRFIPSEMSVLLGLSPQVITNLRGIVNRKLFRENGARRFAANILNIKE